MRMPAVRSPDFLEAPRVRCAMTLALINLVESGNPLARADAEAVMDELLSGRMETPEIVRLLLALNQRPIDIAELAGFASVMRRHAAVGFGPSEIRPASLGEPWG